MQTQSSFGFDYSIKSDFEVKQIVNFLGQSYFIQRDDYKILCRYIYIKKGQEPLGIKRLRLSLQVLKNELLYIKSLYGEKETFQSVFHYFPKK